MSELNIDEIRREWSEFSRRVESATSISTEELRRTMHSDSRVLRRYGWINIIGGAALIPFVLWYVAHHYGFGVFFWLFAAGLAVALVFSIYQIVIYHRAGRFDRGVVQHAAAVVRYMRMERIMTVAVYVYMFCLLMYMLVSNLFGDGGVDDMSMFVKYLAASVAIFAAGVFVSLRIMRWEQGKLRRLSDAMRRLEEFLDDEACGESSDNSDNSDNTDNMDNTDNTGNTYN